MHRPVTVTATEIMKLLERQQFRCALSGRELTPATASLDHIVPLAKGGFHTIDNLWVVDQQVNVAKGTLTLDEFLRVCAEVIRHQQDNQSAA